MSMLLRTEFKGYLILRTDGSTEAIVTNRLNIDTARQIIGGYITTTRVRYQNRNRVALCDEDGLPKGLERNRHVNSLRGEQLVGTIILLIGISFR